MENGIKKNQRFCAFSLAEALITLLIVCLITLASVPVLTKRHRNKMLSVNKESTNEHGKYLCYLKNGVYNYHSEINGETKDGTLKTDYCEFEPPKDARDYTIMVIGGGGGGGASYVVDDLKTFTSSGSYKIPEDGEYHFMLIGGGGGTSDYNSLSGMSWKAYEPQAYSGGVIIKQLKFKKGDNLDIKIGKGGFPITTKYPILPENIVQGTAGGASVLKVGNTTYTATGGGVSFAKVTDSGIKKYWYGYSDHGMPNGSDDSTCVYAMPDYTKANLALGFEHYVDLDRLLPKTTLPPPGSSSLPATEDYRDRPNYFDFCPDIHYIDEDQVCKNTDRNCGYKCIDALDSMMALDGKGADGYFSILSKESYCGEGGNASSVNSYGKYKLDGKIQIKVGKGGTGSSDYSRPGEDGKFSKFGNIYVSPGGSGGKSTTSCSIKDDAILGHDGQASAYVKDTNAVGACGANNQCTMADGNGKSYLNSAGMHGSDALSYGSGGGGGGYLVEEYGVGGNGADGMVYVEW